MADLTDFFGSGGGGGLTPKFQEFNSSGTFTPSASLIAAGGYIEVFLVGGGGGGSYDYYSGAGGEVILKKMYLTSVSPCSVTIGSGGTGSNGGSSVFAGSSAGGSDITSGGGHNAGRQDSKMGAGFGASYQSSRYAGAGSGTLGYGAGGAVRYASDLQDAGGVRSGKANSGQGSSSTSSGGSGYCLIKWYE